MSSKILERSNLSQLSKRISARVSTSHSLFGSRKNGERRSEIWLSWLTTRRNWRAFRFWTILSRLKVKVCIFIPNFYSSSGTVIKMTNPITRHSRWIDPELKRLGYKVEPIQGTKVRPPTQLENFQCTPIKAYPPFDDSDSLASRPMTPVGMLNSPAVFFDFIFKKSSDFGFCHLQSCASAWTTLSAWAFWIQMTQAWSWAESDKMNITTHQVEATRLRWAWKAEIG